MSLVKATYNRADLVQGLIRTGLAQGDIVFFQVSHLDLGQMECGLDGRDHCELLYIAMREAIGPDGTMLLPSFSFSFLRNEDFDVQLTPCIQGGWSYSFEFLEFFRHLPGVVRSADPMLSVAGLGPRAEGLLTKLPTNSYGNDCLYERLIDSGGKICWIGGNLSETPFLHYVEEAVGAPLRFKTLCTGRLKQNGEWMKQGWISTVPIHFPGRIPDGNAVEKMIRAEGLCQLASVGRGEIVSTDCKKFVELIRREIRTNLRISAQEQERAQSDSAENWTGVKCQKIHLPANASMEELIAALWMLPRDIISDGYDTAIRALATQVPMHIHEYPSGTDCWTWLIPEKWTCKEAWLETLDGRRLFSYVDNPLHVVSYSLPVDREVTRDELFEHLHVHPELPDAVPFVFKYYERDWGLCCSRTLRESLGDDRYRVVIRSDFSYGTLKVGEVIAPGKSSKTFVLCAHLCHPAMVNDDLAGVVVGLKVMQELLQRSNLRYTYRFVIVPETIGSIAYLSHHEELIPNMIGGLFLEMLGLENPHALQLSFRGDTEVDRCLSEILKECDPEGWVGPFRTVVGNDERQFNAPGVRVPMLSLSRVMREKQGDWPYYPEYHSSHDTPELASHTRLVQSRDLVLKMIDAVERNLVPVNRYKGEIFCSRYGLSIDAYANPEGNRAFFDIIFLIDGTRSVAEIARICQVSLEFVQGVIEKLQNCGLVEFAEA